MRVLPTTLPLLLLLPLASLNQGNVTSVSLNPPSPVSPGATVTITVAATEPCGAIEFNYGDGEVVTYPVTTLPFTRRHIYPNPGSYTIVVTGQANCSGTRSTVLQVQAPPMGGLAALCKTLDCSALVDSMVPRIEKIFSFPFLIEPGGTILIGGRNFGDRRGAVLLKLPNAQPPLVVGLIPVEGASSIHWDDSSAAGRIPVLSGLQNQNATLQIRTSSGLLSNEYPVQFSAARELRLVPQQEITVTCSDEADQDYCNDKYTIQQYNPMVYLWLTGQSDASLPCHPNLSVCAYHRTAVGTSEGTDVYRTVVGNGWVFDSMSFTKSEEGFFQFKAKFPAGGTKLDFPIWWTNFDGDAWGSNSMAYWIQFFIVGPAGTPHR